MLELRGVTVIHNHGKPNQVTALHNLDLTVPTGQFLTVIGSNGAGKSSLVKIISGAEIPTLGTVLIGGRNVTAQPDYRRARYVARVFDNPAVGTVPGLSIEDSLALAMYRGRRRLLHKAVTRSRRELMREALLPLGLGLENRLSESVGLLSAGQRQSLTIIMATLSNPEVLLLDEHVAALDPATQQRVIDLTVNVVGRARCTALMVTHNMKHAIELGSRLIILSHGRIVADIAEGEKASLTVEKLVAAVFRSGEMPSSDSTQGIVPVNLL